MKCIVAILALIATIGVSTPPVVWAGEKDSVVKSSHIYKQECGSCHMVYPPGMLPARSWEKILSNLDKHFGDNAELDPEVQNSMHNFLLKNSSDHSNYRRAYRFSRSIGSNETPLRITDLPYFKRQHDEIPLKFVTGSDKVKSFSQCQACHSDAEQGGFDEDEVRIPGIIGWDD